jgi:TfoX/Sxy family transcriptional regulator of competence genes
MKYYEESRMKAIRESLEAEVLRWPGVTAKKMFGCPCYLVNKSMFALLVSGGVVLTRLDDREKVKLSTAFSTEPFRAGRRTVKNWLKAEINDTRDIPRILKFMEKSRRAAAPAGAKYKEARHV